jgi:hypothetical protein
VDTRHFHGRKVHEHSRKPHEVCEETAEGLRADDADAHARLKRTDPNTRSNPALRDVQRALAREHGHKSRVDLRRALDDGKRRGAATSDADQYDTLARDVLAGYQTGDGPERRAKRRARFRSEGGACLDS